MRNESGMALIVVMGLLAAVGLIGIGMIAQTVTNTKFYESMGVSYIGLIEAQKNLASKAPVMSLVLAEGKIPGNGILASLIYAVPPPPPGGSSNGYLVGNLWRPGMCGEFYKNFTGNGVVSSDGFVITDLYDNPDKKLAESGFLFKDGAGENGADVLSTWNNYKIHLDLNADASPSFGIYFNASSTSGDADKAITGYLFLISPKNNEFAISEVKSGNPNPGISLQTKSFGDSSIQDASGNNPFVSWIDSPSTGVGGPYDQWHSVDITVNGQGEKTPTTIVVSINGVQVFNYTDTKGSVFGPGTIGLSSLSGAGWPASVTFKNIMVLNTSP